MFSYSLSTFAPLAPLTLEFQTFKLFNLSQRLIRLGGASARYVQSLSFVLPRGRGGGRGGGLNGLNRLNDWNMLALTSRRHEMPLVYPNAPISCMLASKVIFSF